jgi:hypothetical protein
MGNNGAMSQHSSRGEIVGLILQLLGFPFLHIEQFLWLQTGNEFKPTLLKKKF